MAKHEMDPGAARTMPPKRRGLRRWFAGYFGVIALLAAAYGGWGYWLERRLDARLAVLHAAGEPVYPADFDVPTPATGANGADDLIRAGTIVVGSEAMRAYEKLTQWYEVSLPLTEAEVAAVDQVAAATAGALALIDSGLGKSQIRWPGDYRASFLDRDSTWLTPIRAAANLLLLEVRRSHQAGRDADAAVRVQQLVDLAATVDRYPGMVQHLVASGIVEMAAYAAADIAYDVRIDGAGGARAADVRGLIRTFADDGPSRAATVRAMQAERKDCVLFLRQVGERVEGTNRVLGRFASRPFAMTSADLAVRMESAWCDAFRASTDLMTARADPGVAAIADEIERSKLGVMAGLFTGMLGRNVESHYRQVTNCHLAAVALAMRLYAMDHAGRRPETLAELVPAYLPAVPRDPLAAGGPPLRYQASGGRAIVYSVGVDGVDDGGSEKLRPGVRRDDPNELVDRWQAVDAVLRLERPARYFPPARD